MVRLWRWRRQCGGGAWMCVTRGLAWRMVASASSGRRARDHQLAATRRAAGGRAGSAAVARPARCARSPWRAERPHTTLLFLTAHPPTRRSQRAHETQATTHKKAQPESTDDVMFPSSTRRSAGAVSAPVRPLSCRSARRNSDSRRGSAQEGRRWHTVAEAWQGIRDERRAQRRERAKRLGGLRRQEFGLLAACCARQPARHARARGAERLRC